MRSWSIVAALAALCLSVPASAQEGDPNEECERGIAQACWAVRFGNCAYENPRVAIPACTRRLVREMRFFRRDQVIGGTKRRDQAQFYALRGNAYARQGDLGRALADYDLAIKSSQDVYWIFVNRGTVLFEMGEYQAALQSLDDAVGLAPNNPILLNARARLRAAAPDASVRDGASAVNDATRAIDLFERAPIAFYDTLAAAHAENGNFEGAAAIQQRAVDLLPPDAEDAAEYRRRLELYRQNMPLRISGSAAGA